MLVRIPWLLLSAALLLACVEAFAQTSVEQAQRHLQLANTAYHAQDFATYASELETALALNPESLVTRHNLAGGYALAGRHAEAIEQLNRLVDVRADYGVAVDADFDVLRDLDEYQQLIEALIDKTQPMVRSDAYYANAQIDLIPEGIAFDEATNRFFFGSMRSGDIFALDANVQLTKFASVDSAGTRSAIGMTVDPERRLLWVVGTSFNMAEGFVDGEPTATGIFGFAVDSGELVQQYEAKDMDFGLNDVALGADGALYASGDTLQMLDPDRDSLIPLVTEPPLFGTNGVAATPDGRTLFVSSYPVGIAAIDLESRRARFLETPDDVSLYGVDGLYWHQGDLVAVQNGIRPWRLIRIRLTPDGLGVDSVQPIEFANAEVTATTGAIVGDTIYYIGGGPAPVEAPSHVPEHVAPFLGATLIRSVRIDP